MSLTDERRVTVVGLGSATAVPDAVWLQLGAEARGDTPSAALDDCARALAVMASVLRERGVAESALRTEGLNVQPEWHHRGDAPQIVGYQASTTLGVSLRELAEAGSLATAALEAAGNAGRLHAMQLDLTDPGAAAAQARAAAYADARAKAEQYAGRSGVELGDLLELAESRERGPEPRAVFAAAADARESMRVFAGESSLTAVVTATWALR